MDWQKSPAELVARFDALLPDDPRVERRKMFGYPAAFVNGHLFASLYQASVVLKLGDADRGVLLGLPGVSMFEPMPGRRMGSFIAVRSECLPGDDVMAAWVARALEHVAALPPKVGKGSRSR